MPRTIATDNGDIPTGKSELSQLSWEEKFTRQHRNSDRLTPAELNI